MKLFIFYPEYILTLFSGKLNYLSCNGTSVLNELPSYFSKNVNVVIESSLSESDFCKRDIFIGGPIRFLFVGYLRSAKGVDDLINAFEIVCSKTPLLPKLTIVGNGSEEQRLKDLVSEKKLNVVFSGYIPSGDELNQVYRDHDVLVMPSLSETGPRVLLEAMANCLYCISTDVGYAPMVLSNNRGSLVDKSSPAQLAQAMLNCYSNTGYYKKKTFEAYDYSFKFTLNGFFRDVFNNEKKN